MLLVQSTLGWLFRKISKHFNKDAARQYLRRCIDHDSNIGLRRALGENYKNKYAVFLPYIEPIELEDINFFSSGANGKVYRATWNRPSSMDFKFEAKIQVVLKHIPYSLELPRTAALEKFLKEVQIQLVVVYCLFCRWKSFIRP